MQPIALLESFSGGPFGRSYRFDGFQSTISATSSDQVVPALTAVEQAVERGLHAVGFVAYEAATGLNPLLSTKLLSELPLVWFALFRERIEGQIESRADSAELPTVGALGTDMVKPSYHEALAQIRTAIAAGETYQVNLTTRQHFQVQGDLFALYRSMCRNQLAPFCAWLDTGRHRVLSASPELFFSLQGRQITMKPMKGTAARNPGDPDPQVRQRLAHDPKERAENLMIVDLVRNDLGSIAETGSVKVPSLFAVESYPTLHQMTSTVTATLRPETGLIDIFRALFPCGSVTGAPKRRTMEIIRNLELSPRGVYCGTIGYLSPGSEALFSVAIRTAVVDTATGRAEMGIGSGITWDSEPEAEFNECMLKGGFMTRDINAFQLIESLRHDQAGYLLLDRHVERLSGSAAHFGFGFCAETLRNRLDILAQTLPGPHKVRVVVSADGTIDLSAAPIDGAFIPPPLEGRDKSCSATISKSAGGQTCAFAPVTLADIHVDSSDVFLHHKTTRRELFEEQKAKHQDCYDVIFLNERGELTEGSYNTIVLQLDGQLLTPTRECGLLPGVLRAEMLDAGILHEAVLTVDDLRRAERLWLINSVRGWRECVFEPQ